MFIQNVGGCFLRITSMLALLGAVAPFARCVSASEQVFGRVLQSSALVLADKGMGSGVVIDSSRRLVLTNVHVVGASTNVKVLFPKLRNGRVVHEAAYYAEHAKEISVEAKVIVKDKLRDVAILQLASLPQGVLAIEFGESSRAGQNVHSIGNPSASQAYWIYNTGKVRANYYQKIHTDSGMKQFQSIETLIPVSPGDSGGPIVDDRARLVGINQSVNLSVQGFSYGVDISEVKWLLRKHNLVGVSARVGKPAGRQGGASLADLSLFGN